MVVDDRADSIAAAKLQEAERAIKLGRRYRRKKRVGEVLDAANDAFSLMELVWLTGRAIGWCGRILMKLIRIDH
jgi:hypothetical protein